MNGADIEIFGIRHHGPGSARMLLKRLESWQPDMLLIEGPPDADILLPLVADPGLKPPVAILVYNPKMLSQAVFYPFAEFSPEWQAMQYAVATRCRVQFMDLPQGVSFALQNHDEMPASDSPRLEARYAATDPFTEIAALAGYSDPERWWEAMFERSAGAETGRFEAVLELMQALRGSKSTPETPETLLREAWMRQSIRGAVKEGCTRIAVVCGAWHAPALAATASIPASSDIALLKGLKKVKTESSWIPWSFDRLAFESGYRAGIVAPAWYRLLWQKHHTAAPQTRWMTQSARLLREKGIETSSAHVIEAIRLADALATMRNTHLPGIEELREAAVAVLAGGNTLQLELIDREMVVGEVLGEVPDTLNKAPLKADFEAQVKSCRLPRSTSPTNLSLDLRETAQLRKSRLLHRLSLLGIHWGRPQVAETDRHGGFHEDWQLQWNPEFEIQLIEAGTWGNTVEDAAVQKSLRRIRDTDRLPDLSKLLADVLLADLDALLPQLIRKLQTAGALATDALLLADAVLPLVEVLRYGSARKLNLEGIELLLGQIIPRVCIQLPDACTNINEDLATTVLGSLLAFNRALGLISQKDLDAQWHTALSRIQTAEGSAPLLSGFATRLLFDKQQLSLAQTGEALHYFLSKGQNAPLAASWLEGFLNGSGLLLLHHQALWYLLDSWIADLETDSFVEILPVLRRTFSRFTGPEREKMLNLAQNAGKTAEPVQRTAPASVDLSPVLEVLRKIFDTQA